MDGVTASSVSSVVVCVYVMSMCVLCELVLSWYQLTKYTHTHTLHTYLHVPMDAKMGNLYTEAHNEAKGCSAIITGY